jgi:heptosyltransferase-2
MMESKSIAVFLPNWVGDTVMATPALRALRDGLPNACLVGVLKPYVAGVLDGTTWLDSLVFLDRRGPLAQRWWTVAARLRRLNIDLAVLMPNSFHSAWVAWWGRCRSRVGYARHGRSWLLTDPLKPFRDSSRHRLPSPILDAYNRLAGHVGCSVVSNRLELATTCRDEEAADALWRDAGFADRSETVCLNPGAAFGSAKYWPAASFAALAQQLVDRRGSNILVLCGPSEQQLARQIVGLARRPGVHSLAGRTLSLGLTKACVRRADLLVTTDSGPRHFAAAFDRPVITLFGPTHIAWTETYHSKAMHLQKKVDCGPCQRRVCPLDHRCMNGLTPDEVYRAAAALLARFPEQSQRSAQQAG